MWAAAPLHSAPAAAAAAAVRKFFRRPCRSPLQFVDTLWGPVAVPFVFFSSHTRRCGGFCTMSVSALLVGYLASTRASDGWRRARREGGGGGVRGCVG